MDESRTTIDLKRLAAEVSVQHGIRVDPDDPMMAVVTLNRLVFEQAIAQVLERVQAAVKDFETAADKVQVRAGGALAQEIRDSGTAMRVEVRKMLEEFRQVGSQYDAGKGGNNGSSGVYSRLIVNIALALALLAVGFWLGGRFR